MAMQANVPTASMAEHWARRVRSYARRRRLAGVASDLGAAAFAKDGRDADELIDEAQRALAKIAEEGAASDGDRSLGEILPALMETLERRMAHGGELPGLSTGIGDLDERILGLKGGELVIVAGRPSMGKTTLAVQFAREAAKEGKTALIFSLEMRPTALAEALLSSIGHIDAWKLRSGKLTHEDWSEISATYARASGMPIRTDGSPRLTLERMRARARQVKRKHGLSIIVLDYIQLMEGDAGEERNQQVAAISRGLKLIANELDVPVVALSQLNRSCEARTNKRPMMSDLRDSGAVEADADVILFVYRDEVYNHDDAELKGKAEIIVGKQREGEGGTVYAAFVGHHKRFADTDWRPQRRESKRRAAPDDL
jgi:replicative DNA helicase